MKVNHLIILGCIALLWSMGCAKTGALGGGPRDKTPPVIDTLRSSRALQTNFQKSDLVFVFDEYIVLKNPASEISVSPPLTYRLLPKLRGKKLTLQFNEKEVLKDSVTYKIDFGKSIQDFHEGNVLEDYAFIFSTGPYIDSLRISGRVYELEDQAAVEEGLVVLFEEDQDSIILDGKPFYFARVDKQGKFELTYLKSGVYRLYAFNDENNNKTFNFGSEALGFLSENIVLSDTMVDSLEIAISYPEVPLRVLKSSPLDSQSIVVLFSESLDSIPDYTLEPVLPHWTSLSSDSLKLWIEGPIDSLKIAVDGLDTSTVLFNTKKPNFAFQLKVDAQDKTVGIGDTLWITSSVPIVDFADGISVLDTSDNYYEYDLVLSEITPLIGIVPDIDTARQLSVEFRDSSLVDLYGRYIDSTRLDFTLLSDSSYVDVTLKLTGLDTTVNNIVSVAFNKELIYQLSMNSSEWEDTLTIQLEQLMPGPLSVKVIEDRNGNGRWDPVQIIGRVQAERKHVHDIPPTQAGVNLEQVIDLSVPSKTADKAKSKPSSTPPRR